MAAAPNVFVLTVLVQREGGLAAFLTAVAQSHRVFAATPGNNRVQSVWRIDLAASLNRIVNQPLGLSIELLAAAVVLILAIVMMGRLNKSDTIDQKCVLEGLVCCTMLLSLYHQAYDLLLLTLPAVAFARILYERRNPGRIGIAQSLLFSVLGLNYFATHSALEAFPLTANQRVVVVSVNGLALIGLFALYLVEAHQLSTPRS